MWNQDPGDKQGEVKVAVLSHHGSFHGFYEDSEQDLLYSLNTCTGDNTWMTSLRLALEPNCRETSVAYS